MSFVLHFVLYLICFAAGALVALVVAAELAPARSAQEAFADLDEEPSR